MRLSWNISIAAPQHCAKWTWPIWCAMRYVITRQNYLNQEMPKQQPYDALIKARCYKELVARIARVAAERKRAYADMLRVGFEEYADAQEKALRLKEITPSETEQFYNSTLVRPPTRLGANHAQPKVVFAKRRREKSVGRH